MTQYLCTSNAHLFLAFPCLPGLLLRNYLIIWSDESSYISLHYSWKSFRTQSLVYHTITLNSNSYLGGGEMVIGLICLMSFFSINSIHSYRFPTVVSNSSLSTLFSIGLFSNLRHCLFICLSSRSISVDPTISSEKDVYYQSWIFMYDPGPGSLLKHLNKNNILCWNVIDKVKLWVSCPFSQRSLFQIDLWATNTDLKI